MTPTSKNSRSRSKLPVRALLASLAVSSCTLVFEARDVQCEAAADCSALGLAGLSCRGGLCVDSTPAGGGGGAGGSDTTWGCVGTVTWDQAEASVPVTLRQRYLRLFNEEPIPGLQLQICNRLDSSCVQPLGTAVSDVNGVAELTLYYGFDGHLLIEPNVAFPELMPAIFAIVPPVYESNAPEAGASVHLVTTAEFNSAVAIAGSGVMVDPAAGHLFGLAVDCLGRPTAGITITSDTITANSQVYYMAPNGLPSATQVGTSERGEAGYINLPEGIVTIRSTSLESGQYSAVSALIRAGHITYLALAPSPL